MKKNLNKKSTASSGNTASSVTQIQKMSRIRQRLQNISGYNRTSIERNLRWKQEILRLHSEPAYSIRGHISSILFPQDIVEIFGVHLRNAQRMLQNARFLLEKGKMAYVTVKDFCNLNELNEEWMLNAIDHVNRKRRILEDTGEEETRGVLRKRMEKKKEKTKAVAIH